jgi:hypothetical protein
VPYEPEFRAKIVTVGTTACLISPPCPLDRERPGGVTPGMLDSLPPVRRHGHERATARAIPSFPFVFCDVFCVIAFCMPPSG